MQRLDLTQCACRVLRCANAQEKAELTRSFVEDINGQSDRVLIGHDSPDIRPARPERPELHDPRAMAPSNKRNKGVPKKIVLLHAIAHIELNAIDLAWDMIARFAPLYDEHAPEAAYNLPIEFFMDWLSVAGDEAKHFLLLNAHLKHHGAAYGDLAAHDGLWESAEKTRHDIAARLAIVPMVLEARGLDVTPGMIKNFEAQNDSDTASILKIILSEEVNHVRIGRHWFEDYCLRHNKDGLEYWQSLVRHYFGGKLKPPFNHDKRQDAGMIRDWYEPLAD
tara:strand:+ start:151825 stop:152661 length:837 start_codon:yes stop_codon:yes gene_type:complete